MIGLCPVTVRGVRSFETLLLIFYIIFFQILQTFNPIAHDYKWFHSDITRLEHICTLLSTWVHAESRIVVVPCPSGSDTCETKYQTLTFSDTDWLDGRTAMLTMILLYTLLNFYILYCVLFIVHYELHGCTWMLVLFKQFNLYL